MLSKDEKMIRDAINTLHMLLSPKVLGSARGSEIDGCISELQRELNELIGRRILKESN